MDVLGNGEARGQGIYGIIKDSGYFVWASLRDHTMEVVLDVSLDTLFLDGTIADMLARMFPGCDLDDPEILRVGHAEAGNEESAATQNPDGGDLEID
jgi:hypothetical protein